MFAPSSKKSSTTPYMTSPMTPPLTLSSSPKATNPDWSALALALEENPDYKVLRRLNPEKWLLANETAVHRLGTLKGVVLDTETTGMNSLSDKVIELGMIVFEYDPVSAKVVSVSRVFNELEDPGFAIPPESTEIHHITDAMVKGKSINDQAVHDLLQGVSLVIAHNARFDRPFVENRWPIFTTLPWGCSIQDVNWRTNGVGSAKLEYLAMLQGVFYEAHRAVTDCWALLEILNMHLSKENQTVAQGLFESIDKKEHQVYAIGAPFESKDLLKSRAYRWNAEIKSWSKVLGSFEGMKEELAWLKVNVYGHKKDAKVEIETFSRLEKYSDRPGDIKLQSLATL